MERRGGSGPPDDLAAFYADQYPRVTGALVLFTGSREVAEELAQEAFVKACQHWERVRALDASGAWVHRVAINLAISRGRRRNTERRLHDRLRAERLADAGLDGTQPGRAPAATPLGDDVRLALLGLPPDERATAVLRFYGDFSVAETARVLECPEGTVKTRTRRALALLREAGLGDPDNGLQDPQGAADEQGAAP
jgi:RNA polymerase sigma-70 factor (ECF subfamily)